MKTPDHDPLIVGSRRFDGFLRIRHADPHAGFCALMTYALNGVRRALERNRLPVVDYSNHDVNGYFFDPQRGDNVWDYYFGPVMDVTAADLDRYLANGRVSEDLVYEEPSGDVLRRHTSEPGRIATFWAFDAPDDPRGWMERKRALGRDYVERFIHVQPHIAAKACAFHEEYLKGHNVCGVHVRGTDFAYADPTPLRDYFRTIRDLNDSRDCCYDKIFLATDQVQFVEAFRKEFGPDAVVTYSAMRSDNDVPAFMKEGNSAYRRGEDVLVDVLLLSKCGYLLKGAAAVGEYAMWFNPSLECADFAVSSSYDFTSSGSAYLKLNVAAAGARRWRGELLWRGVVKGFRRMKRPVMETGVWLGNRVLPKSVRDYLWKKYVRHIF